jgi:hypothetical protein
LDEVVLLSCVVTKCPIGLTGERTEKRWAPRPRHLPRARKGEKMEVPPLVEQAADVFVHFLRCELARGARY